MVEWKNLDTLASWKALEAMKARVDLTEAMAGENGAKRVAEYSVPMAAGLSYNYAAKAVNEEILTAWRSWPTRRSWPASSRSCTTAPSSTPVKSAWCCIS